MHKGLACNVNAELTSGAPIKFAGGATPVPNEGVPQVRQLAWFFRMGLPSSPFSSRSSPAAA
jgi:hypothetical protein